MFRPTFRSVVHISTALSAVLLFTGLSAAEPPRGAIDTSRISMELIMSDPDWMGRSPERAYWADDGGSIYFSQKREGEEVRDLIRISLDGEILEVIEDGERFDADVPGGTYTRDRSRKLFSRAGNLFIKEIATGEVRQLTRTTESNSSAQFMHDENMIVFRRGGTIYTLDLTSGFVDQPADLRAANDPDSREERSDYLREQQLRLFDVIREQRDQTDAARERRRAQHEADPTRVPPPWYLGSGLDIVRTELSPAGTHMLVVTRRSGGSSGRSDSMPQWVTEDGYVQPRSVRSLVGTRTDHTDRVLILNLATREQHEVKLAELPGITEDPLAEQLAAIAAAREAADETAQDGDTDADESQDDAAAAEQDADATPARKQPRVVRLRSTTWNHDGSRLVVQIGSVDNKDRWIAEISLSDGALKPIERLHDPAWINWRFASAGFLHDEVTLWYLSEEKTGYSHLYLHNLVTGEGETLTEGAYEVSSVSLSHDGSAFYFTANRDHPGVFEGYRLELETRELQQLTSLGGTNSITLSPDESMLLVEHSTALVMPELYLQRNAPGAPTTRLTHTNSEAFLNLPWRMPEYVEIPSSHGELPVHSRLYTPEEPVDLEGAALRPAVIFIHGAGYLQNAHQGWSRYFREFMFHTLLTEHGYVVLDPDYRASAGYGRDWRTAIYRRMGTPEIEDLRDCIDWLVEHHHVDRERIGIYGGSYGGFLTLMAMFRAPELFVAGAALRPVTDWAHYNHGYTSNILNIPELDAAAYEDSSPIEFAEGLRGALLMCHGMLDDNVFFKDTVRLAQRLIELEKENWEVAIYPVEPHGFRRPSSWLDEYRRIFKLFEQHLK